MKVGDKLQEIIDSLELVTAGGTPVNAVSASKVLSIDGVVVDGETLTVNHPAVTGSDVYEFMTDAAQTKTAPTNIAVDISASAVKAHATLTIATQPTAANPAGTPPTIADTMTIWERLYTFVPDGTAVNDGEIPVGTNLATAKAAIIAAVNGTDGVNTAHTKVTISAFSGNVATVTALIGGVSGNAISILETFAATDNVFSSATLLSGSDCSATNAATALASAITAHDTQGVAGVKGSGDTVTLTADVAGALGNTIVIGETMTHGSFAGSATLLGGGVNATIGLAHDILSDSSYLYVCSANNTVADSNWRRISLGSAY